VKSAAANQPCLTYCCPKWQKSLETCPSPSGRRWRGALDEGSPPQASVNLCKSWSGLPSPGAPRHPLPVERAPTKKPEPASSLSSATYSSPSDWSFRLLQVEPHSVC
jgi:hypothetical protein